MKTSTLNNLARVALTSFAILGGTQVASAQATPAKPAQYTIASSSMPKAMFNFRVTLIPVVGTINEVAANLKFDPSNLKTVMGAVEVQLEKLDTGIGLRDQHAKDALGAEKFPKAKFELKRITGLTALEVGKEVKGSVFGNFTLKGVTKPMLADVTLKAIDKKHIMVHVALNVTLAEFKIDIPGADPVTDVTLDFTLESK
jgi:polyisoprenoid-binding protein YceI